MLSPSKSEVNCKSANTNRIISYVSWFPTWKISFFSHSTNHDTIRFVIYFIKLYNEWITIDGFHHPSSLWACPYFSCYFFLFSVLSSKSFIWIADVCCVYGIFAYECLAIVDQRLFSFALQKHLHCIWTIRSRRHHYYPFGAECTWTEKCYASFFVYFNLRPFINSHQFEMGLLYTVHQCWQCIERTLHIFDIWWLLFLLHILSIAHFPSQFGGNPVLIRVKY